MGSPEAGNQEIAVAKTPFSLSRLPGMTKGSELLTLISTVTNILVFAPQGVVYLPECHVAFKMGVNKPNSWKGLGNHLSRRDNSAGNMRR